MKYVQKKIAIIYIVACFSTTSVWELADLLGLTEYSE